MSHPDVFMTLTCYHNLSPDFGQQITGYYRQNSSSRNTYIWHFRNPTPSWVKSESYGFSRLSPSATQTPPGQLLSENSKKNTPKIKKSPQCQYPSKWLESPNFWHFWHFRFNSKKYLFKKQMFGCLTCISYILFLDGPLVFIDCICCWSVYL